MSPKLPRITAKDIARIIERKGFALAHQSGSHKIYRNAIGLRVTIPFHAGTTLHPKVLKSILKDADLKVKDIL